LQKIRILVSGISKKAVSKYIIAGGGAKIILTQEIFHAQPKYRLGLAPPAAQKKAHEFLPLNRGLVDIIRNRIGFLFTAQAAGQEKKQPQQSH
jgi:hypothetical protein